MSGFEVTEATFQDAVLARPVEWSPVPLPWTSSRARGGPGGAARRAAGERALHPSTAELRP